jgi:hypothetical protein
MNGQTGTGLEGSVNDLIWRTAFSCRHQKNTTNLNPDDLSALLDLKPGHSEPQAGLLTRRTFSVTCNNVLLGAVNTPEQQLTWHAAPGLLPQARNCDLPRSRVACCIHCLHRRVSIAVSGPLLRCRDGDTLILQMQANPCAWGTGKPTEHAALVYTEATVYAASWSLAVMNQGAQFRNMLQNRTLWRIWSTVLTLGRKCYCKRCLLWGTVYTYLSSLWYIRPTACDIHLFKIQIYSYEANHTTNITLHGIINYVSL